MSIKFFGILTHQGAARLANAAALGAKLELSTMAVGDGGGSLPFPDPTQTALKGERRRAALNQLSVDPLNGNQIIAEQVIPENEGGWWIREMGLFDKDGTLIAVANCPESYKPQMQEGSGRTQTIRMILIVNSTKELALKIDPSIVLATRHYVDDGAIEVKAYADTLMATHIAHADPHPQYAPKASPVFTGVPKAPTAKTNNNSTQLATTAFVQTAQNACLRKEDNLAVLKDKAKSRANLDVYSRTEADNHYLPKTGGIVNGPLTVEGKADFTGELHASGGATFGSNVTVSWGGRTATFQENGDVVGPIWGGALSAWLNNQIKSRTSSGDGWWKDESTGYITQYGNAQNLRVEEVRTINFHFPFQQFVGCIQVTPDRSGVLNSGHVSGYAAAINNASFTLTNDYANRGVNSNYWWMAVGK